MRNFLLAAAVSSATLLTACPLAPSCGGFDGEGDMAFRRGNDFAIVCANGGFSGQFGGADFEGRLVGTTVIEGATGGEAFQFAPNADAAWSSVALDEVQRDHADVLCQDLATRDWWTVTTTVPEAVALVKPATTIDRRGGEIDVDIVLLCPTGTAEWIPAEGKSVAATYSLDSAMLQVSGAPESLFGTYHADGRFGDYTRRSPEALGLSCADKN